MKVKKPLSRLDIRATQLMSRWLTEASMSIDMPYLVDRTIAAHVDCWPLQRIPSGNELTLAYAVVGAAQNPFGLLLVSSYAAEMPYHCSTAN